jgi:hypothetical protein
MSEETSRDSGIISHFLSFVFFFSALDHGAAFLRVNLAILRANFNDSFFLQESFLSYPNAVTH